MTKHHKSYNSTQAVKHNSLKQLLRSALVAGVVGGFASPVSAQSDLTLPQYPQDSTELSLPVPQDVSLPVATFEPKQASPTTSQRVAMLLGLKKLAPAVVPSQTSEVNGLPTFPSTEPNAFVQPNASASMSLNSQTPTIFRSTSGRTDNSQTQPYTTSISLASADESLSQIEVPTRLTSQPVAALDELTEGEYLDASSSDSKSLSEFDNEPIESLVDTLVPAPSETLLDIEVPKSLVDLAQTATQTVAQTLTDDVETLESPNSADATTTLSQPILVQVDPPASDVAKRSPAIQLHIGGDMGTHSSISDSVQTVSTQNNFSMSDAGESEVQNTSEVAPSKTTPKTLKVKIEGEPAQVVTRSIASAESYSTSQKKTSFDPASYVNLPPNIPAPPASVQHAGIQSLGGPLNNGQNNGLNMSSRNSASQAPSSSNSVTPSISNSEFNSVDLKEKGSNDNLIVSSNLINQSIAQKAVGESGNAPTPTIGARLEVGLHESSNVETTQPINGVSVEHAEICQVLKNGERSLSLVGLKAGQTRVALFTTSPSGERKIEIREVIVAGTENRQADINALATEITKSVRRMYPNSRIEVIAEEDGLAVQGYAGSEAEAKKIISLIRRTSLQPVVDRLATYK